MQFRIQRTSLLPIYKPCPEAYPNTESLSSGLGVTYWYVSFSSLHYLQEFLKKYKRIIMTKDAIEICD